MLRTAGRTLPQATNPSSTRMRARSAALSGEGSVVKTRSASVTAGGVPGREGACQSAGFPGVGWTRDGTHPYYSRLFTAPKTKEETPMIDVKRLGVLALVCAVSTSSAFAKGISGRDGEPEPEQDRGDAPHTITFFCTDLSDLLDVKVAVIVGTNQLVVPNPSPIANPCAATPFPIVVREGS